MASREKAAVNEADIIVLGAGPAGCAASIRARQAGLRVIMFDAKALPNVSPGETLHPGVEPLLKQLDVFDLHDSLHRQIQNLTAKARAIQRKADSVETRES